MGVNWGFFKKFFDVKQLEDEIDIVDGKIIRVSGINDLERREYIEFYATDYQDVKHPEINLIDEMMNFGKLREYKKWLEKENKKRRTIEEYVYDLRKMHKTISLNEVKPEDIRTMLSKYSPTAQRRKVASLRSYARWLYKKYEDPRLLIYTDKVLGMFIFFILIFTSTGAEAREDIPIFAVSSRIVKKCYSGWDLTVNMDMGLGSEYKVGNQSSRSISTLFQDDDTAVVSGSEELTTDELGTQRIDSTSSYRDSGRYQDEERSYGKSEEKGIESSVYIGVKMSIPLYSREYRIAKQEKKNDAVAKLADLYAKYDGYTAAITAMEKQCLMLEKIMIDSGYKGVSEYFNMQVEIVKSKALRNAAARKILAILQSCGFGG